MIQDKIEALISTKFEEEDFANCFLVEIKFNASNNTLQVYIDHDIGLNIVQCRKLSRYLEAYLDESQELGEKYVLEVSSPGLDQPLQLVRQYKKNIGRELRIKLTDGNKVEGEIVAVTDEAVTLETLVVTKIGKKKKKKEMVQTSYPYNTIAKAKIKISFKGLGKKKK